MERALTPRQLRLLHLRAHGHTNREATTILWLSLGAVKMEGSQLLRQLGARNICDAIRIAYERGILPLDAQEEVA